MNYLAHFSFCPDSEENLAGMLLGDFVKGQKWKNYAPAVADGIHMHRFMDSFTDNFTGFAPLKQLLSKDFGIWRGVVIDVFTDHVLAKNWDAFFDRGLEESVRFFYRRLRVHTAIYPPPVLLLMQAMQEGNWLYNYQYAAGIQRAFMGMHKRIKRQNPLHLAPDFLAHHEKLIDEVCLNFLTIVQAQNWHAFLPSPLR